MESTQCASRYSQLDITDNPVHYNGSDISTVPKQFPSVKWKIFHGTHSMLGAIFLIGGSCMYFADIVKHYSIALTVGGWFFTLGSFFLLLADLQEWWYNRHGCCSNQKFQDNDDDDEEKVSVHNQFVNWPSSRMGRLEGNSSGCNSFTGACGSACYVAGSGLLIPVFERYATLGNWLIIAGSVLIFFCAIWRIYRIGRINTSDRSNPTFRFENIFHDLSTLRINIFIGLGGMFYFLGIMCILVGFTIDEFGMNLSAIFCVIGGVSFLLASIFLQFGYYCGE